MQVDFEKRTVKTLLELPGMVSFKSFQRRIKDAARLGKDENETEYVSAVRGRETIVILDSAGHASERFVIPAELRDKSFDFYEQPDGTALVVVTELNTQQRSQSESVIWINRDGTIARQMRNATEPWFYNRPTAVDRVLPGIAVPAPIFPLLAAIITQTWTDPDEGERAAFARCAVDLWPSFAIAGIAALCSLWLYWKRTTKFGERRQVRWVLFLALGGLPAYVAYLVHRRWPVRVACPACHVEVPRDREKCAVVAAHFRRRRPTDSKSSPDAFCAGCLTLLSGSPDTARNVGRRRQRRAERDRRGDDRRPALGRTPPQAAASRRRAESQPRSAVGARGLHFGDRRPIGNRHARRRRLRSNEEIQL